MRLLLTLFFASLSTTLLGQGVVPSFQIGQVSPLPFSPGTMPGTDVRKVHFAHLPGDPANVFYCAVTVRNLAPAYGGVGGWDLVCGSYDVLTDTFIPSNEAAALSTFGEEHDMTLHHTGLFAAFDDLIGGAWLASRRRVSG